MVAEYRLVKTTKTVSQLHRAPMEFANEDELQAFLAQWLEEHGHNVYREVKCPEGGAIDILTQKYAIECRYSLTSSTLSEAADQLRAYKQHFPEQKPVIAGLTPSSIPAAALKAAAPESDTPESGTQKAEALEPTTSQSEDSPFTLVTERIKNSGIEVWFIDQMGEMADYYAQSKARLDEPVVIKPRRKLPTPLAGLAVALGMAAILAGSFAIAFSILADTETRLSMTEEEQVQLEIFDKAAQVWDLKTAQAPLKILSQSKNRCLRKFATQLQDNLNKKGAEGFRDLNPIKRNLNDEDNCKLEVTPLDFSP